MQRSIVWAAFVLSLVLAVAGCSNSADPGSAATSPVDATPAVVKDPNVKYHRVSLEVPTMSCPFACWPKVKKTLESQPGVGEVTLAPQKESDVIDKPVVFVEASDKFQGEEAVQALAKVGFDGAKLSVQE